MITAQEVSKLRKATGLPMMACKKALISSEGNFEKAVDFLRKDQNKKITVKNYTGKSTGIYCFSGFRGNIIKEKGAVCSQCGVFINQKDIPAHNHNSDRFKHP